MDRNIKLRIVTADFGNDNVKATIGEEGDEAYIIAVNSRLSKPMQAVAFLHECLHLWYDDLHDTVLTADQIESLRHGDE